MSESDWVITVFTVVGVLVAIGVASYTVYNDKKNLKLHGLGLAFEKFNNRKMRLARRKILRTYATYLIDNGHEFKFDHTNFHTHEIVDIVELDPKLKDDIIQVKSDFEEIAVMEKNGLVDEKAYFDAYWGMLLRCFAALHGNIENSRKRSGSQHYTTYFEAQHKRAIEYWAKTAYTDKILFHK